MKQYNNYLATTKGDKGNRIIDHNYVMNKGQGDYRRGHISLKYLPNPAYIFGMNNTLIGGQYASGMFNPHSYSGQNYERNLQKMIRYIKGHKVNTYRGLNDYPSVVHNNINKMAKKDKHLNKEKLSNAMENGKKYNYITWHVYR